MSFDIIDTLCVYDFAFQALDDDGNLCVYDALFSGEGEDGTCYLVYADPDDGRRDVSTYASVALDPQQLAHIQDEVDAGRTPQQPPVIELTPIEGDDGWAVVEALLAAIDAEDD